MTENMPTLKPCPFCGCKMTFSERIVLGETAYEIEGSHYEDCPVDFVMWYAWGLDHDMNPQYMAETWNRRSGDGSC